MIKYFLILFIFGCGAEEKSDKSETPENVASVTGPNEITEENAKSTGTLYFDNLSDLPPCGESTHRQLIYVAETADFRACTGTEWAVVVIGKTVETKTVEKTIEKTIEKLVPAETFGNWSIEAAPLAGGVVLDQVTIVELPDSKVRLTVTAHGGYFGIVPTVILNIIVEQYSMLPVVRVDPSMDFSVTITDWEDVKIQVSYFAAMFQPVDFSLAKKK